MGAFPGCWPAVALAASGRLLLGAAILVDVEDEAVARVAPHLEVQRRTLFELAKKIDRLVETQRKGCPPLREAFDGDLRGPEPTHGVLEADKLGKVHKGTD